MPTKNRMSDLRDHLFAALEGLVDKENPMPIDRAQAIASVSGQIINLAKAQISFMKLRQDLIDMDDTEQASKFFLENAEDPRINPPKGLSTGKHIGSNGETNGKH